jgi:hypothetical protein
MKMDTWKDVIFNNYSIGIIQNHENLFLYEDKDTKFDCVMRRIME